MENAFKVGDYVNLNPLAIAVNHFYNGNQFSSDMPKIGDGDGTDTYSEILKELSFGVIIREESYKIFLDGVAYKVYQTRWARKIEDLKDLFGYTRIEYVYEKALLPNTLAEKSE